MKRGIFLIIFVCSLGSLCFAENLLALFKRPEVTKVQIASCFEKPTIDDGSISSNGEGYDIHIVTIGFIDGDFVHGWITFKDEKARDSNIEVKDANIGLRFSIERLISLYGFRYLSHTIDDSPNGIGEEVDLWMNNYWQFAIRPIIHGVEILAAPLEFWNETLASLEKAMSR